MKIVCAWCGKDIGEKEPLEDKSITHGICEECLAKNFPHVAERVAQIEGEEGNPGNPDELPYSRKTQELIKIADPNIPFNRLWTEETAYMNRLLADIREHGIREPLIVLVREDGSQMVWEGAHRLAVAQRLGITDIPVKYVGPQGKPAPPGGNPDNGRCYEEAWRFLMKEGEGFLVHGTVRLYEGGRAVKHAWVELPAGWIWEPQTKSYFTLKDFEITSPIEEHRYTAEEAAIMVARVGKHGPWTDEERARWLPKAPPGGGSSGNPKEPWQMTRDEFSKIYPFKAGADAVHRSAVFGAVYQGKPVPPEVLADYPDLRKGGNPMTEKKRQYSRPFLVNWQYAGYSYVEEDPDKPESQWVTSMVDFVNPDTVITLAEREGIAVISLAGGFWARIGYKGWGEKVSISEARTALAKAKQLFAPETIDLTKGRMVEIPLIPPEEKKEENPMTKETHKERMARQEEQLKRGEERLVIGREALAAGRRVLKQEMTPEEIDREATKLAAKVLEETAPSVLDPAGKGLLLHFTEHEIEGAGLVVNEAKARASPCNCFTYKDREYCFSPGVIGMMSSRENPEQIADYCKLGKTYEVKPGAKQRFESFAGAAEAAHKKIEGIPKGEKLVPWLGAMSEELERRDIEV